ncbi:tagatose-6-phosphate kinase [Clostridium novyi A str. 4552]|uniref:Tagatose-6-phosphate kinase n=1 Tax=Clostridium novyi A str. 4552 TaxID=1444289 RepID=A0A0A0IBJ9_CLONO|nr:1-phosphofructokinase [Clostridium novyi]KGM98277.1 tagatose-6-phosphate kinase [Clostridium novyi A str. 4552]
MIGIITLNPSVDRRYMIDDLNPNFVHRCEDYSFTAGGKGLNVARVANQLKQDSICLGFLGGFSGKFIESKLNELNIENDFSWISGETRTCLSLIAKGEDQVEVLEKGPIINEEELEDFKIKFEKLLNRVNLIVASGSLPKGINKNFYNELIKMTKDKGKKFILDASGETLIEGIKAEPFLVKPNKEELEGITKRKIQSLEEIIEASKQLVSMGTENVAVSLGSKGMLFVSKDNVYRVKVPKIEAVNAVGSGDSTVAGFATGFDRNYEIEKVLRLANACGVSNTMEKETGVIREEKINDIMDRISIEKLS